MIDYLSTFTNTNSVAFPDTFTVNATGPSATNGTELVKLFGDDLWGFNQALMDRAGLTPDGVTEAPGTSQRVEALNLMCCAPGIGTEWSLALDPAVTGHRAILRQGQGILRASYPDLDAAVYVGDANNAAAASGGGAFYRADNANGTSPNIVGVYLILDDARGVTTRGLDIAAAIDPDGASRFLGDIQVDGTQIPAHSHYNGVSEGPVSEGSVYGFTTADMPGSAVTVMQQLTQTPTRQGLTSTSTIGGGTETVMYNRSANFVIWY